MPPAAHGPGEKGTDRPAPKEFQPLVGANESEYVLRELLVGQGLGADFG